MISKRRSASRCSARDCRQKQRHRDRARCAVVAAVDSGVLAGDQRREVGRDRQRLGEPGPHPSVAGRRLVDHRTVRHDGPRLRRDHRDREAGFEIGLLEATEDPARLGRLELGVQIGASVDRIDEAMQTLTAAAVAADRGDGQFVRSGSELQREARVLEAADLERVAVQARFGDGVGNEIQMRRPGCPRGELQGHRRAELLGPARSPSVRRGRSRSRRTRSRSTLHDPGLRRASGCSETYGGSSHAEPSPLQRRLGGFSGLRDAGSEIVLPCAYTSGATTPDST